MSTPALSIVLAIALLIAIFILAYVVTRLLPHSVRLGRSFPEPEGGGLDIAAVSQNLLALIQKGERLDLSRTLNSDAFLMEAHAFVNNLRLPERQPTTTDASAELALAVGANGSLVGAGQHGRTSAEKVVLVIAFLRGLKSAVETLKV